ncbi:MAG: type II toxin-antitoxin system VapC family toxin [Deltaproteobacteria bacterium]|nr:type II toxin-antitoxin system VapC family toxin [Deltaproteobacteria bacterium]
MQFLLDTNICIYLIKKKPPSVLARFRALKPGDVGVSSITTAELHYGVEKSQFPDKNRQALAEFLLPLELAPFDEKAAAVFGKIRTVLERKGRVIGSYDMLIAAHAISLDATLVTNNTREFSRIADLKVKNWV